MEMDSASADSSFDDSGYFTMPTLSKYQISTNLLLHWKGIARCALILNLLYAIAWGAVDYVMLR